MAAEAGHPAGVPAAERRRLPAAERLHLLPRRPHEPPRRLHPPPGRPREAPQRCARKLGGGRLGIGGVMGVRGRGHPLVRVAAWPFFATEHPLARRPAAHRDCRWSCRGLVPTGPSPSPREVGAGAAGRVDAAVGREQPDARRDHPPRRRHHRVRRRGRPRRRRHPALQIGPAQPMGSLGRVPG